MKNRRLGGDLDARFLGIVVKIERVPRLKAARARAVGTNAMDKLLTVAVIVTALLIYAFLATKVENDFQRQVGVTQYHNDPQREPL